MGFIIVSNAKLVVGDIKVILSLAKNIWLSLLFLNVAVKYVTHCRNQANVNQKMIALQYWDMMTTAISEWCVETFKS